MKTHEYLRLLTGDREADDPLFSTSEYTALLWRHRLDADQLGERGLNTDGSGRAVLELSPLEPDGGRIYLAETGGWIDQGLKLVLDGSVVDPAQTPFTAHGAEGRVVFDQDRTEGAEVEVHTRLADLRAVAAEALLLVASDRARLARKVELDGLSTDLSSAAEEVRRQARAVAGDLGTVELGGGPFC